jgi:hypothetical protein
VARCEVQGPTGKIAQAPQARAALTGAAGGEPGHDPGGLVYSANVVVDYGYHPATEGQPRSSQRDGVKAQPPKFPRVDPSPVVPAQKDGPWLAGAGMAQDVLDGPTGSDLVDARLAYAPGDSHQSGPRVFGRAGLPVPVGPIPGDKGQMGERFDIVDQGRKAIDTPLEGSLEGRLPLTTVYQVDQSALLAG